MDFSEKAFMFFSKDLFFEKSHLVQDSSERVFTPKNSFLPSPYFVILYFLSSFLSQCCISLKVRAEVLIGEETFSWPLVCSVYYDGIHFLFLSIYTQTLTSQSYIEKDFQNFCWIFSWKNAFSRRYVFFVRK